ncbi:MAG: methionine synthase [Oscillospiraceae bacterium]|nr:methionine synthase [Oscillospiraceae bacterium]
MSALSEALRYMRSEDVAEIRSKAEKALNLLRESSPAKYLYRVFGLEKTDNGYILSGSGIVLRGKSAETMLHDCHRAAIMICTLGFGFEAELRKAQARSMADAVILDACGSALVEEACDEAEREISSALPGMHLTDRFSPGYGDLSLDLQTEISRVLNAEKLLGVHLNESLLFYPSKTVSAIIGIADEKQPARIRGCDYCSMRESCALRKRGGSCGK